MDQKFTKSFSSNVGEIAVNKARFWSQKFSGGPPPEFWNPYYKIEPTSNHVAKFHGDSGRSSEI